MDISLDFFSFLSSAITVFGNVKDTLMFSKHNYSLKAILVADCYVPNYKKYLTCNIKRSPDAEKIQFICQTLLLVLLNSISQYHDCYDYGVLDK